MKSTPESLALRMSSLNRTEVSRAVMQVLSGLEKCRPEVQSIATCLIFLRLMKAYGLTPGQVMEITNNIYTDGERVSPEFRSVDDYIAGELAHAN